MRELLDSTDCVLFDFDGPVCRLFVRHPAPQVAARLRTLLEDRGASVELTEPDDPYAVLRAGLATEHAPELLAALTAEEVRAAASAWPTPYVDQLLQTLHATGRRLAIATDAAEDAVERYLHSRGLAQLLTGHIHGRDGQAPTLMPDPDAVRRALASTGTAPERALLVGDSPQALATAAAAGVRFCGYAHSEAREAALREAGARYVATSLLEVVDTVNVPHPS